MFVQRELLQGTLPDHWIGKAATANRFPIRLQAEIYLFARFFITHCPLELLSIRFSGIVFTFLHHNPILVRITEP